MSFKVIVNLANSTVTWTTYDVNGNVLATGSAATMTACAAAAIASLKASMTAESTALSGDVTTL
jgi:hypothetical protein